MYRPLEEVPVGGGRGSGEPEHLLAGENQGPEISARWPWRSSSTSAQLAPPHSRPGRAPGTHYDQGRSGMSETSTSDQLRRFSLFADLSSPDIAGELGNNLSRDMAFRIAQLLQDLAHRPMAPVVEV